MSLGKKVSPQTAQFSCKATLLNLHVCLAFSCLQPDSWYCLKMINPWHLRKSYPCINSQYGFLS